MNTLVRLRSLGIAHTGLKIDNIIFVNASRAPYGIKIIDFGLTRHVPEITYSPAKNTAPIVEILTSH